MRVTSGRAKLGAAIAGVVAVGSGGVSRTLAAAAGGGISGVSVRTALLPENLVLTTIINDSFRHGRKDVFKSDTSRVTDDGKQVAALIETPCNAFLVAEEPSDDGTLRIVGCIHVCWAGISGSKDSDIDAQFGMLSVLPECKQRGIGKLLVASAEQRCLKELRRNEIIMEIQVLTTREDLFAWYEAQGYKLGKTISFPAPDIVKEGCDLRLQLMAKTIY